MGKYLIYGMSPGVRASPAGRASSADERRFRDFDHRSGTGCSHIATLLEVTHRLRDTAIVLRGASRMARCAMRWTTVSGAILAAFLVGCGGTVLAGPAEAGPSGDDGSSSGGGSGAFTGSSSGSSSSRGGGGGGGARGERARGGGGGSGSSGGK